LGTFLIKDGLDSPAVYNAIVNAGQEFEAQMWTKACLKATILKSFIIHVSCLDPIAVRVSFGNLLQVRGGSLKNGGPLCDCDPTMMKLVGAMMTSMVMLLLLLTVLFWA
jgi:hypothetical protein